MLHIIATCCWINVFRDRRSGKSKQQFVQSKTWYWVDFIFLTTHISLSEHQISTIEQWLPWRGVCQSWLLVIGTRSLPGYYNPPVSKSSPKEISMRGLGWWCQSFSCGQRMMFTNPQICWFHGTEWSWRLLSTFMKTTHNILFANPLYHSSHTLPPSYDLSTETWVWETLAAGEQSFLNATMRILFMFLTTRSGISFYILQPI